MLPARPNKCFLLIRFAFRIVTRKYVVNGKLFAFFANLLHEDIVGRSVKVKENDSSSN